MTSMAAKAKARALATKTNERDAFLELCREKNRADCAKAAHEAELKRKLADINKDSEIISEDIGEREKTHTDGMTATPELKRMKSCNMVDFDQYYSTG